MILAISSLILTDCKRGSDMGVEVSTYIDIAYKDHLGNDLLSSSSPSYFSANAIQVYTMINGTKTAVHHANYDYPQNFLIYKNDSLKSYFIRIFLENNETLLQLNPTITDTLTYTVDNSNGNSLLTKLWYNGSLKWAGGTAQEIVIMK